MVLTQALGETTPRNSLLFHIIHRTRVCIVSSSAELTLLHTNDVKHVKQHRELCRVLRIQSFLTVLVLTRALGETTPLNSLLFHITDRTRVWIISSSVKLAFFHVNKVKHVKQVRELCCVLGWNTMVSHSNSFDTSS